MTNKCMKRWSTSLVIRETQVKITMRYHYTPALMADIKNTVTSVVKIWRHWNTDTLLVGLRNDADTLQPQSLVIQIINKELQYYPAIFSFLKVIVLTEIHYRLEDLQNKDDQKRLEKYFQNKDDKNCAGQVAQLVGASSWTPKFCGFDFWSVHVQEAAD